MVSPGPIGRRNHSTGQLNAAIWLMTVLIVIQAGVVIHAHTPCMVHVIQGIITGQMQFGNPNEILRIKTIFHEKKLDTTFLNEKI